MGRAILFLPRLAEEQRMTELLERAFAELAKLPNDAQDAIAARLLVELTDEAAWSSSFASTTEDQWASLADMARREIVAGAYPL
jgi:hypothetical protein